MNLPQPVTVQPPPFTRKTGEVRVIQPITLTSLDINLMDSSRHKVVAANVIRFPVPVVLWKGDAYDVAGDYTQAQAEARLLEVLGPDLKAGLESLFVRAPAR
jgi:hypothetical protein